MLYAPESDSTILTWRSVTVRHAPPPVHHFVYLIHFDEPYKHARHYLGSSSCLDARLRLHRNGNGARLMEVISEASISWELARLWECTTWSESRDLERHLKKRHNSPQLCPICQGREVDILVFMRQGHWPFSGFARQGGRQPMSTCRPVFVQRERWGSNMSRT